MPSDYYLQIGSSGSAGAVTGESVNPNFTGQIELDSFSFGASNPADVGGAGLSAGKCSLSDFSFTCALDSSSWQIVKDLYAGTHLDTCVFSGNKAGGGGSTYMYIQVTMTNCYLTSQSTGGGSQGVPSQSVSIAYAQIEYQYYTQDTTKGTTTSAGTATYSITTGVTNV
jgi:type VI secretion system secreted protein Hcp